MTPAGAELLSQRSLQSSASPSTAQNTKNSFPAQPGNIWELLGAPQVQTHHDQQVWQSVSLLTPQPLTSSTADLGLEPRTFSLEPFPTLPPRGIQPQTPPRLPCPPAGSAQPQKKDRRWSGKRKKNTNKSLQILIFLLSSPRVIVWQDENFSSGCAGEQD